MAEKGAQAMIARTSPRRECRRADPGRHGAAKAIAQVKEFVEDLLAKKMPEPETKARAATLTEGRRTHDFPISVEMARGFGLPVSEELPKLVYELMDLYP